MNVLVEFLKSPPGWLMAVLCAFLVAHAVKLALPTFGGPENPRVLVCILEVMVTVVLCYLTLHSYLSKDLEKGAKESAGLDQPNNLLWTLIAFTFVSLFIYYCLDPQSATARKKKTINGEVDR